MTTDHDEEPARKWAETRMATFAPETRRRLAEELEAELFVAAREIPPGTDGRARKIARRAKDAVIDELRAVGGARPRWPRMRWNFGQQRAEFASENGRENLVRAAAKTPGQRRRLKRDAVIAAANRGGASLRLLAEVFDLARSRVAEIAGGPPGGRRRTKGRAER